MNAPTPLHLHTHPAPPAPAGTLTAAVRAVDRLRSDGTFHHLVVALLCDGDTPILRRYLTAAGDTRIRILDAFDEIYRLAEQTGRDVLVYIGDHTVRRNLIDVADSFPHATFATNLYDRLGARLAAVYAQSTDVIDDWDRDLTDHEHRTLERLRRQHVTVYTDGSVSATRPGAGMGAATTSGNLHTRFDPDAPNDPLVAELLAIELAVREYPVQALTIRADNRDAVRLLSMSSDELSHRRRRRDLRTDSHISSVTAASVAQPRAATCTSNGSKDTPGTGTTRPPTGPPAPSDAPTPTASPTPRSPASSTTSATTSPPDRRWLTHPTGCR
ncbi:hypothetical protein [Prescottella subtropica]|uniref:hypothetical protein n=1 Tax=Prescottella subtropica TaxID=2545757 RepID=UPI001F4FBD92|nr:hypothetical protein [Prescottella subtropica]